MTLLRNLPCLLIVPCPCHHRSFSHITCLCNDAGNLHSHPAYPRHEAERGFLFLFPRRGVDMTCFSVF
ncbi:hypothetical protein HBI75_081050 [Parastagonospora nodorum]|nr:hypothetical protein HBI79_123190 [Parastagonospora nodorum]KAH5037208.1 hypothetical protein HBI75_081050 [Parastagonospora nodorum]KAH5078741.1 hypothetical protein HBH95_099730 [Parastagonospora nodorum]KAH5677457.1 hypothetical protein HBI21_099760 [Parastagonospora nodorum]KAH5694150.1 hypothetical protein HBI44_139720 [Parastagonospora nodorum]